MTSDMKYLAKFLKCCKAMIGHQGPIILHTGILEHSYDDDNEDNKEEKIFTDEEDYVNENNVTPSFARLNDLYSDLQANSYVCHFCKKNLSDDQLNQRIYHLEKCFPLPAFSGMDSVFVPNEKRIHSERTDKVLIGKEGVITTIDDIIFAFECISKNKFYEEACDCGRGYYFEGIHKSDFKKTGYHYRIYWGS